MVGRRKDILKTAAKTIADKSPEKVCYVCADATIPEDTKRVISHTCDWFGRLDIPVNNVGGAPQFGSLKEPTLQDWRTILI